MDPTANLNEQLRLAEYLIKAVDRGNNPDPAEVIRLSELVIALNHWVINGGAIPRQWQKEE